MHAPWELSRTFRETRHSSSSSSSKQQRRCCVRLDTRCMPCHCRRRRRMPPSDKGAALLPSSSQSLLRNAQAQAQFSQSQSQSQKHDDVRRGGGAAPVPALLSASCSDCGCCCSNHWKGQRQQQHRQQQRYSRSNSSSPARITTIIIVAIMTATVVVVVAVVQTMAGTGFSSTISNSVLFRLRVPTARAFAASATNNHHVRSGGGGGGIGTVSLPSAAAFGAIQRSSSLSSSERRNPRFSTLVLARRKSAVSPLHSSATRSSSSSSSSADHANPQQQQQQQLIQNHLVIVESPAKCATIEKILNSAAAAAATTTTTIHPPQPNVMIRYMVTSCMGHIRNLLKKKRVVAADQSTTTAANNKKKTKGAEAAISTAWVFPYAVAGVDLAGGTYAPEYAVTDAKLSVVRDLQRLVRAADRVLLATDPDREGEAMAWHLADVLHLVHAHDNTEENDGGGRTIDGRPSTAAATKTTTATSLALQKTPYHRIRFSEITKQAILAAVQSTMNHDADSSLAASSNHGKSATSTTRINANLVAAQETRRVLDRLAGYTVSPVLWKKIAPGLSAGRVQSVGLQMIVARELQRLAFEVTPYYDLTAELLSGSGSGRSSRSPSDPHKLTTRLVSINGTAVANSGKDFSAQNRTLTESSKHKYHLVTESDAVHWVERMTRSDDDAAAAATTVWTVHTIKSSKRVTKAPRPYKTSTLQQEAARRLGLPVQHTMRAAQQLYEAGCISYMRTDSTVLSQDAERAVEAAVSSQFGGAHMVADAVPMTAKDKDKFAQEAHEAIRPAIQADGQFWKPNQLPSSIFGPAVELYRMIYQRTLAHRMPPLITNQTQVVIAGVNGETEMHFRTSGSVVVSPGYTLVYTNNINNAPLLSSDDGGGDDDESSSQVLPPLVEGQVLQLDDLFPVGHVTQPPPRYTEASFVKELEALGVGRPSTYAGIVQILRDRAYVGSPAIGASDSNSNRRRGGSVKAPTGSAISAVRAAGGEEFTGGGSARGPLVPSLSAIVVCALLEKHCPTYIDPTFTARMEDRLDRIASGDADGEMSGEEQRVAYLDEFYAGENGLAAQIKRIEDSVDASDTRRAVLPALLQSNDGDDDIGLYIGPWGPYVQQVRDSGHSESDEKPLTAPLPPGMAADISTIKPTTLRTLLTSKQDGGTVLGQHPDDGRNVRLKTGRFGAYLQWGNDKEEGTTTHSLPRKKSSMRQMESFLDDDGIEGEAALDTLLGVTLEEAIAYLSLPRTVATLDDKPIVAAIGPYGPYLKYNGKFLSLNECDGDVLTIDAETAELLVTDGIINRSSKLGRGVIADLGEKEGSSVTVKAGRFGAYLNWKKVNAKLPVDYVDTPEAVPLEEAWSLIQAKAGPVAKGSKATPSSKKDAGAGLPLRPKRPVSAYLHFCAAKRSVVSESVKTLGEVSKKLASLWAETSTEDRREYEKLAATGKIEYEMKLRAWEVECQALEGKTTSKTKSAAKSARLNQDVDAPRNRSKAALSNGQNEAKETSSLKKLPPSTPRTASAYMLFCRELRPFMVDDSGEKLSFGETTKRLASRWRDCDDETRAKFHQLAAAEKEKTLSAV